MTQTPQERIGALELAGGMLWEALGELYAAVESTGIREDDSALKKAFRKAETVLISTMGVAPETPKEPPF